MFEYFFVDQYTMEASLSFKIKNSSLFNEYCITREKTVLAPQIKANWLYPSLYYQLKLTTMGRRSTTKIAFYYSTRDTHLDYGIYNTYA